MTADYLALGVAGPLLGAALAAVVPRRVGRTAVLIAVLTGSLVLGVLVLVRTFDGTVLATAVGSWPGGIAIAFAADPLTGLLITTTAVLALVSMWFAVLVGDDAGRYFAPLVLVLMAGVNGALLTADLFNFFVFVEVMLAPSYALIALYGRSERLAAARVYVSTALLASTLLLVGVGLLYGTVGAVNLASLAGAAKDSPVVAVAGALVLLALAMEAAVAPVYGWLPQSYPYTTASIRSLFSALHTKVAVYGIFRVYSVLFAGEHRYLWVGLVLTSISMLVGALGALGERTVSGILVFGMISQIGYILLGVALFSRLALAAGIFYLVHHMIVKSSLFLSAGAVENTWGTDRLDSGIRGLARRQPWLAAAFFAAALSLAGVPPMSGFFAKLLLLRAALAEHAYLPAAVAVVASLLTLIAMLTIWRALFMDSDEGGPDGVAAGRVRPALIAPGAVLAAASLALGIGAQGLWVLADHAAGSLLDVGTYVEAVLGA